jgi:short subunit fatty acids transporter
MTLLPLLASGPSAPEQVLFPMVAIVVGGVACFLSFGLGVIDLWTKRRIARGFLLVMIPAIVVLVYLQWVRS